MGETRDCRTCRHNIYRHLDGCTWVMCGHPVTLEKTPRWKTGDPAWVNVQTGDIPISRIAELADCHAFEASRPQEAA